MAGKFIVLEGLSAVGKTTIASLLAERLKADLVGTVPQILEELRHMVCYQDSLDARYTFFFAAMVCSSQTINEKLKSGKDVVCESFIYRTIAFHRGMGSSLNYTVPTDFPIPDFAIHLRCAQEDRCRRLSSREKIFTAWDQLAEDSAKTILHEYSAFSMIDVDTTNMAVRDLVELLAHIVETDENHQLMAGHQDFFSAVSGTPA